jgi:nicotinamide phosphoribosyltransferase
MNPLFLIDFYKVGHVSQYPEDTTQVWSNWTARSSRVPTQKHVVFFGLQYFIKKILFTEWDKYFFYRPLSSVIGEYLDLVRATLGVENPKTDHIEYLHKLGHLPLDIWALPEGTAVPLRVPSLVITNTDPKCYWLPNYFETILSNFLWKPSTSATIAQRYRRIFERYAIEAGETDLGFVDWMGHDFSFRGMSGPEDAIMSGMGHLLSFSGTDTVPAIVAAHDYYGAKLGCGGSVPATEHSVMCAGGKDDELETFRHLIEDVYPSGIVSIVSDTWDLWKVLTEYIPTLKDTILARNGKVVIRPDSGDPVLIMCGNPDKPGDSPVGAGVLRLLAKAMGTDNSRGDALPLIIKAGAIYGDSITPERAEAILERTIHEIGLSPYNCVFGIGSFTYEYQTRDTFGFAMKATAVRRNGEIIAIFKKPVTDDGVKNSAKGIPIVNYDDSGCLRVTESTNPDDLGRCEFQHVYSNGCLLIDTDFDTIRKRVRQ